MMYQFADVNGTKIHYEERGEGKAIVLIHAGIVNMGMWDAQMGDFAERHRVVRYDIRGWGESAQVPGECSNHEDLRGLLTYLDIEQAAIVGCSWGGKVGLDFALVYPEMVTALVLVGTGLGGYKFTMAGIGEKMEAIGEAYQQGDKALMAELITQIWFDGPQRTPEQMDAALRARAYEMTLHMVSQQEVEGSRVVELDPPAIERLTEIATQTLLLVGQEDAEDIFSIAKLLEAKLPMAEALTIIADTAHLPNMERPSHFNRLVLDFLERIGKA
jgi:pimeloyl-ACP methyl ester carboxylesterase